MQYTQETVWVGKFIKKTDLTWYCIYIQLICPALYKNVPLKNGISQIVRTTLQSKKPQLQEKKQPIKNTTRRSTVERKINYWSNTKKYGHSNRV